MWPWETYFQCVNSPVMLRLKAIKHTNDYFSFVCILLPCEQGFETIAWIFAFSPSLYSGTSPWILIIPSQSQDRDFKKKSKRPKNPEKEPQKPALLHPPAPSFRLFQEYVCLSHPAAGVWQPRGCCGYAREGQWPPASPGTGWWLLPSQLGSRSSSWYKSCQAASTPRILKAFGAIIYAMCFSVFTA